MASSPDRISNLPETVICHILSFLPAEDQIRTALLSKNWVSLWSSVPDLYFYATNNTQNHLDRFAKFVDTVLLRRRLHNIRKLRLQLLAEFSPSDTNSLVRTALSRNVQEIDLDLRFCQKRCELSLVSSKSLVVLKLIGVGVFIDVSESDLRFPSLKTLHLNWVASVPNLLSGCPVLEDLVVNKCCDDFRVSVPSLRRLAVDFQCHDTCNLVVQDAPVLEYLSLSLGSYKVTSINDPVIDLLLHVLSLSSLRSLKLFCSGKWKTTVPAHFDGFPMFNNLVCLEIYIMMFSEWDFILRLLESCHKLENIYILKLPVCPEAPTESWIQPSVVPKCFSSRLKTFHFEGLNNSEGEMDFAIYVLENAMVLKKMVVTLICSLSTEERCSVVTKLTNVAVGSKACQLIFK